MVKAREFAHYQREVLRFWPLHLHPSLRTGLLQSQEKEDLVTTVDLCKLTPAQTGSDHCLALYHSSISLSLNQETDEKVGSLVILMAKFKTLQTFVLRGARFLPPHKSGAFILPYKLPT